MRRLLFLGILFTTAVANAQTATEYYDTGVKLKNEKKPQEAITSFKEAVRLKADYHAAWYEMGWCMNDTKDYTGALASLRKARTGWSSVPKVHYELGYAFDKLNLTDSAIKEYNKCLDLNGEYSLAYKQLGTIYYYKDDYDKALGYFADYEQFTKLTITDYLYWYRKGFMLNSQKRFEEATTALKKSLEYKTDYINTPLELGFAASRLKQNDVAINYYKKAIEIDPGSHIAYNGIGEVYRDFIKNREEAMTWYRKALVINSKERKACFGMGYCYNALGKYNDALPYLKTAIEQQSDYTAAYVELGYCYYMLSNYSLGVDNLKKAISLNPANMNARYYCGLIYIAQKNKSLAQQMVNELKELNSKDAPALQEKVNKM